MKKKRFHCPIHKVNFKTWATTAAVAVGLLAYYLILVEPKTILDRTIFYAFQSRDIARALNLLNGMPIFFGPEMTGGGNLPGPFYYIFLIPGLLTTGDWRGAWYLMVGMAAVAGALGWFFLRRRQMPVAALLFLTLLPLSVVTQHYMTLFINPSYLFAAVVLALILICDAFSSSKPVERRDRSFVLAGLTIGLAIQIHYSIIFLFFAALFMQWRGPRLGLPRVGRRHFTLGLVAFVIPFVPYWIWSVAGWIGQPFGQPSVYVGQVADVWPTMLHLLSAVTEFDPAAAGRRMIIQVVNNLPWALALFALVVGFGARPSTKPEGRYAELIRPLTICAAFGFIPFSYVFFVPIANRYSLPMVIPLLLLTAVLIESLLHSRFRLWLYNGLAVGVGVPTAGYLLLQSGSPANPIELLLGVFLALMAVVLTFIRSKELPLAPVITVTTTALIAALHLQFYRSGGLRTAENNMVCYSHWRIVWQEIYRQTGWSLEELKYRVYFVNAHTNGDPEPTYLSVIRDTGPIRNLASEPPDGYLLIVNPPFAHPDLKSWLISQPIAEDLKLGLKEGTVELLEEIRGPMLAVGYRVKDDARLPQRFHNWGLFYNRTEYAQLLGSFADNQAHRLAENRFFFLWNECPDLNEYCDNAADVTIERRDKRQVDLKVNVIGESLSQNSPWIHPTWTQAWNDPYVEIECKGQRQTISLGSSIGYRRDYLVYEPVTLYFIGNNSILAPYERHLTVDCPEPLTEVTVGRASSSVDQVRGTLTLPAQKLSLKL